MAKGDIHTGFDGETWTNRLEGSDEVVGRYAVQMLAWLEGHDLAKANGVSHHLHRRDGSLIDRLSR